MNWHVGDIFRDKAGYSEMTIVSITYRRNAAEDEGHKWTDEIRENATWRRQQKMRRRGREIRLTT
jgi:hypothetical protein